MIGHAERRALGLAFLQEDQRYITRGRVAKLSYYQSFLPLSPTLVVVSLCLSFFEILPFPLALPPPSLASESIAATISSTFPLLSF